MKINQPYIKGWWESLSLDALQGDRADPLIVIMMSGTTSSVSSVQTNKIINNII